MSTGGGKARQLNQEFSFVAEALGTSSRLFCRLRRALSRLVQPENAHVGGLALFLVSSEGFSSIAFVACDIEDVVGDLAIFEASLLLGDVSWGQGSEGGG